MNLKFEEKYNAVVLVLSGKLVGGPFMQEMNETLHKLIEWKMFCNELLEIPYMKRFHKANSGKEVKK